MINQYGFPLQASTLSSDAAPKRAGQRPRTTDGGPAHETPVRLRRPWPRSWPRPALAAEPESCAEVRFSDVGWTDITATTAVDRHRAAGARLRDRGQHPLGAGDLCRALARATSTSSSATGCRRWRPTSRPTATPAPSRCCARTSTGAKYTLAVSNSLADAGLKDFADIAEFGDAARQHHLRHRARQRRQPADPRHDRAGRLRPRRLRAQGKLGAGDAGRRRSAPSAAARGSSSSAGSRIR